MYDEELIGTPRPWDNLECAVHMQTKRSYFMLNHWKYSSHCGRSDPLVPISLVVENID